MASASRSEDEAHILTRSTGVVTTVCGTAENAPAAAYSPMLSVGEVRLGVTA